MRRIGGRRAGRRTSAPPSWGYLALSRKRRQRRWSAASFVLVVIVVAVYTTYRSAGRQRADLAAADLASKSTQLAPYDSYGAMQLALRAYRTNSGVKFSAQPRDYPGADRLLPDYTQARVDKSAPAPSTSAIPGSTGMDEVIRATDSLSSKVSADGTRMVTTNSAKQVVLWTIDGDQVRSAPLAGLFGVTDFATRITISRSGRYLAFEQSVWPAPLSTKVNGPVDADGLPKINPDDYHTCKPGSIKEVVTCLVVYDIDARQVTAAIPLGGALPSSSIISIDPDDQVVAAVRPGGSNPLSVQASENTLRRWDLHTGREWDPLRIPWHSWLGSLRLRAGGTSAVVWEFMPDSTGIRPDRVALTLADLGPAPQRRELAYNAPDAVMSLDGRTVAAIETSKDGSSYSATAWNTESGEVITRIPGLSKQQGEGSVTLTRNGSVLGVLWSTPMDPNPPADIEKIVFPEQRLTVWSLPDGAQQSVPDRVNLTWTRLVPLADTMNGPMAVTRISTVGLVLPRPGQATPLRRLADAAGQSSSRDNGELMNRLCAVLADPNTDKAVRSLVPPDASQEPLCPS